MATVFVCIRTHTRGEVENRAVGARSNDVTRSMFHQVRGHAALFFPRDLCNDEAAKRTFNAINTALTVHVSALSYASQ